MEKGIIPLDNDKSPLEVIRYQNNDQYSYYIPSEKVILTSTGSVLSVDGSVNTHDKGIVTGDTAVAFRALVKIHKIQKFILEEMDKSVFNVKDK